jgi:hypothetical protein
MNLKEEKQLVFQELINIMNEGLSSEDLTSELLRELRDKIDEMILNDF